MAGLRFNSPVARAASSKSRMVLLFWVSLSDVSPIAVARGDLAKSFSTARFM